jgi:hypothetical protein
VCNICQSWQVSYHDQETSIDLKMVYDGQSFISGGKEFPIVIIKMV